MSVTGAVLILIVAVVLWLAISAAMLFRAAKRTTRRLEGLKAAPLFRAVENAADDLEKLQRAAVDLPAQLAALRDAQAKLSTSLRELRKSAFGDQLAPVRRAYAQLITTLQ